MKSKNETKEITLMKEASSNATSLKEISEITGIDYSRILYILDKHPVIKDRLKKSLKENKKNISSKTEKRSKQKTKSITVPQLPEDNYIVIDASICGARGILSILHKEITQNNVKVILTDVTINELEKIEDGDDNAAYCARRLLANSNNHPDTYVLINLTTIYDNPDNSIVEFAKTVKNCVLFTSDKAMSLKAKANGTKVSFFVKPNITLFGVYDDNKIDIGKNEEKNTFVLVLHKTKYIYDGTYELEPGDEVYSFKEKDEGTGVFRFVAKLDEQKNLITSLVDKIFVKNKLSVPYRYRGIFDLYYQLV